MAHLGLTTYSVIVTVIIVLLLDRGINATEKTTQSMPVQSTSPWFPSGPPPTKVPEEPSDALKKILPRVTFDCRGKTGYFSDSKFNCEVFHYCKPDGTRNTFLCPAQSLFNQLTMVCEDKSAVNFRICKGGSVGTKKETTFNSRKISRNASKASLKKKYSGDLNNHRPHKKHSASMITTTPTPRLSMPLEHLLNYMNSDHQPQASFVSPVISKMETISNSEPVIITKDTTKMPKEGKKFNKPLTTTVSLGTSYQTDWMPNFNSGVVNASKHVESAEDVSIEYDAIEGRKKRNHKRMGRVLDIQSTPFTPVKRQKHSHVSARSPTDSPPENDILKNSSILMTTTTVSPTSSSPRLFTADRSKAKDFRKNRRRNLNRRIKIKTTSESYNSTEASSETTTPTTADEESKMRTSRRKKISHGGLQQSESQISQSWLGISESGKVEPYTLPPLPTSEFEINESPTKETVDEEKPLEKENRNPWFTPSQPTSEEIAEGRFGEKITDSEPSQFRIRKKKKRVQADVSGFEENMQTPLVSEDFLSEEYSERLNMQPKQLTRKAPVRKSRFRAPKKLTQEGKSTYYSPEISVTAKHSTVRPEDLFPPPRAEPREQSTRQRQQMLNLPDFNEDINSFTKTTEQPAKVTTSYMRKYRKGYRGSDDIDTHKWKLVEDKSKKVEVGSIFSSHTAIAKMTAKPKQLSSTTSLPTTGDDINREGLPKHVLAHQHLLKLMNDFFATTSATNNSPDKISYFQNMNDDMITPSYRVTEEDVFEGSESITEEVEEIPHEVLEVVDFIAGQSDEENRKDDKSDESHEIIKINGPITDSHLKEILAESGFDGIQQHKKTRKESMQKFVIVPPREKDDMKKIAEFSKFTSLRLEPFMKQMRAKQSSVTVIPLKNDHPKKKPAVVSAKKVPVRVIYKNQMSESSQQKVIVPKPNVKIIRSRLPNPSLQVIHNGRMKPQRSYSQPHPNSQPAIVIQPSSLYPPHPPPLQKKSTPFKFGFPFSAGNKPLLPNMGPFQGRKKRSTLFRNRRQVHQNRNFLPFPRSVFPGFNPKFVPTFSPFKTIFSPNGLHTSGSTLTPFSFPLQNPHLRNPSISQNRPAPVRHVTQSGHQTVIVEEVPIPIHVEVPDPNVLRPVPSGTHQSPILSRYPNNQFRSPAPPAIQTPPLVQRPQGRHPSTNYRPFGMPSEIRPPLINYPHSIQFSNVPQHLTNPGQQYLSGQQLSSGGQNGIQSVIGNSPPPFNHFSVHANSYPNFPYFQGAFTTPISNEPVPGRIMYSGYKPPKSTPGTKRPRTTPKPTKERKERPSGSIKPIPSRSKPSTTYYSVTPSTRENYNYYQEVPNTRTITKPSPVLGSYRGYTDSISSQNLNNSPKSNESPPRRRRPGKRRRPRPHTTPSPAASNANDISPTPPPPEQIPAPPADYTIHPLNKENQNYSPPTKGNFKPHETSSIYPPAGYYGKDQLVQFFDTSSKPYRKSSTPAPYYKNDLGEATASAELAESVTSFSGEDNDQPVFGTRLKSNQRGQPRKRKRQPVPSPTQQTEVRMRPENKLQDSREKDNNRYSQAQNRKINSQEEQTRKQNGQTQRRRRPLPNRSNNRQPPSKQYETRFKQEGNKDFYSVPRGLQNLVAPSEKPSNAQRGSTDMFGIPHPVIDHNIYSYRPEGAPIDFSSSFFSVPPELAKQHEASVQEMNMKAIPESARNFFSAPPDVASKFRNIDTSEKSDTEEVKSPTGSEKNKDQRAPTVRKVRKPKRKNRYNPRNKEERSSTETSFTTIRVEPTEPSALNKENIPVTTTKTTTALPRPIYSPKPTQNIQSSTQQPASVFKPRSPLMPKTLPDLSKSLLNGKLDIKKLNATISTSVSVSGPFQNPNNTSSEESSNKRVFSSQNGGLAVVRSNPKRKRKQKFGSDANEHFGSDGDSSSKAKYEIAASVLDIIKATTEAEKQGGSGFYSNHYDAGEKSSASKTSNAWSDIPSLASFENKRVGIS